MKFADFNGDGKLDYIWLAGGSPAGGATPHWYIAYGTDTGFTTPIEVVFATPSGDPTSYVGSPGMQFIDANGDGKTDFMWNRSGSWYVSTALAGNDTLTTITRGMGTSVGLTYKPLTNSTVYTKDSGVNAAVFPVQDVQAPLHVVSSVATSNALGGVNTTSYNYGGLKYERGTGRGMLGFRWIKSQDQSTQIETYTELRQDFPYAGLATRSETRLAGAGNAGVLKRTTNTPACKIPQTGAACVIQQRCDLSANSAACKAAAGNRYFTYIASSLEESWDLNGATQPSITTNTLYGLDPVDGNLYGDPIQITVGTSDGSSKTSINEYWPADTTNWILGRLKKATVTSVKP